MNHMEDNDSQGSFENQVKTAAGKVRNHFNDFAGIEKLEGFSVRNLMAEVFKKHPSEEVEKCFAVGTEDTTPELKDVDTSWPRPWLFFRALAGSSLVYFLFNLAWESFKNVNLIPGLMAVGTVAIPLSACLFFFEMNARRNISIYVMLRLIFLGGIVSLIISLLLFSLPLGNLGFLGYSIAGLIEEPGKLLALLFVARSEKHCFKINGLVMGAAIGTGFAVFESLGYAFRVVLLTSDKEAMTEIIMLRGVLSPFMHIAWTAIAGAAIWRVKGGRKFSLDMFKDARFWKLFLVPVVLHMIWNADFTLPYYLKNMALGAVAWMVVFALIQEGLKELRKMKEEGGSIRGEPGMRES